MTLTDGWQKVAAKTRSWLDRVTHSRDRARAARRVSQRRRPNRVVVVCYGNICRSPYAEASLRRRLSREGVHGVEITSAGFIGPDRPANNQGSALALAAGLDLSAHRSRLFTSADAEGADLILVMTREQRDRLLREFGVAEHQIELLGDFDVSDPPNREIPDPYGRPDEEFRRVFGQIERSIEGLCGLWTGGGAQTLNQA